MAVMNRLLIPSLAAALLLLAASSLARQDDAAPPPPDGPYTQVFFQPGSARLDPRAVQELSKWAAAARDHPDERVLVSGYADSVGSLAANRGLSARRARAVARALADLGVDPRRIDLEPLGETEGAVPTADGVSEPLNRRASVGFNPLPVLGACSSGGVCAPQRGVPFCPGDRRCKRGGRP